MVRNDAARLLQQGWVVLVGRLKIDSAAQEGQADTSTFVYTAFALVRRD